ncbi:MAG: hypothetical protein ACKOWQ_01270 [Aquirufa sp.]
MIIVSKLIDGTFFDGTRVEFYEYNNGDTITVRQVLLKGRVYPKSAIVKIDYENIPTTNGEFQYRRKIFSRDNHLYIEIIDGTSLTSQSFNFFVKFSKMDLLAEKKDSISLAMTEAKLEKAGALLISKEKEKEQKIKRNWENSKAGRLQRKHPDWTEYDCERVANHSIWIGMTLDMLKTSVGRNPSRSNQSNYGNGVHWQYCFDGLNPSCFYDTDDNGTIDSYN